MKSFKPYVLSGIALIALALVPFGLATAQVTVTAAEPAAAPQGTLSLDVTVSGNGFDSTAAVSFFVSGTADPGGIAVKKVAVRGSKKLVATIDIAAAAVVDKFDIEVRLSNGRKGKGTTLFTVQAKSPNNDPCAAPTIDFPAFTYVVTTGVSRSTGIYVADATGQCSRLIYEKTKSPAIDNVKFSYPVAGTANVGRVVWKEGAVVYGLTFTVSGTAIAVSPRELIYDDDQQIITIDLSKDGTTAYGSWVPDTDPDVAKIIEFDLVNGTSRNAIVGVPGGPLFWPFTYNEDGALFSVGDADNFFRIEPSCNNLACVTRIPAPTPPYGPAASHDDDRLVYSYRVPGLTGCWLLQVISDTGGPILNSSQPRYGEGSTWYRGKILTNGSKPPSGSGVCSFTGMITQIDPDTGAEIELVKGSGPDAR